MTPPKNGTLPRYLTQEQLASFLRAIKQRGNGRDLAMFGMMYRFGLRVSEVVALQLHDLHLERGRVMVRRSKGGDSKEYPLPKDLLPILRRYLRHRIDRGPFLFTGPESTNQHGLHRMRVQHLFKEYTNAANLPADISSHALRHSIAVHALQSGFGLEYVADLLGHTSTRSTAVYAKIIEPGREAMMRDLDRSRFVVGWR